MRTTIFRYLILIIITFNAQYLRVDAFAEVLDLGTETQDIEETAQEMFKNIRCMVCANQSIQDSNSDFAQNLKLLVIEKLKTGQKPDAIYDHLAKTYGKSVLYKTPFLPETYVLWLLPAALLVLVILIVALRSKSED